MKLENANKDILPIRLKEEPVVEAVWEVRIKSVKGALAEVLSGILFNAFKDNAPEIVRLPTADIPSPIIDKVPNFRYFPKVRLEAGNKFIQIGDRVVSVSCRRPYPGWNDFSKYIRRVIHIVSGVGMIECLERFSLKYMDMIQLDRFPGLRCLDVDLRVDGYEMDDRPVLIRTEISENKFVHVLQVVSSAEIKIHKEVLRGVLVDIDTIRSMREDEGWSVIERELDEIHLASKKMFFSILRSDALQYLGPEYGGE